ncbi:protein YqgC [Klebsiella pneumoniae]|nr:protein YqgC [Klebsiella pneumoniae]
MLTRDRTTRRIKRKTLVHYLVSPPHRPATGSATSQSYTYRATGATPLRDSVNTDCLTRLEVAPQGHAPVRFFNEPRAAFYTEKRGKKQNKNVPVCAVVRKFCQAGFPINATAIKKGWKWAQDLT